MSEGKLHVRRLPEQPGILYVIFDNPPMNQFTTDLWRELTAELRKARVDDTIGVVVLTGAGERAFSAGLSMDMLNNLESDEDSALIYACGLELREALFALNKPVIAAVKGNCVGGGLEIALCCDMIVAAEGAKFMLPEMNIGLVPGCGGAIHLMNRIAPNRAFEMILFSEKMMVDEALRLGLVNRVYPKETFDEDVRALCEDILKKPPVAVRALKELSAAVRFGANQTAALAVERRLSVDLMRTEDFKEAVKAFREKRAPVFKGR
jgi:enoyl-CoA hydratase/carnithine racemase